MLKPETIERLRELRATIPLGAQYGTAAWLTRLIDALITDGEGES
jgi:hypothetical protein